MPWRPQRRNFDLQRQKNVSAKTFDFLFLAKTFDFFGEDIRFSCIVVPVLHFTIY
jgi:hypothetical protein